MVNLSDFCDLPLTFDELENQINLCEPIACKNRKKIGISNISHTLLNKFVKNPEFVYEEYTVHLEDDSDVFKDNLNYDVLILPPGLLGIEYIKSHIYYTPPSLNKDYQFSTIVEAIKGETTVIMQKNKVNIAKFNPNPSVEEGVIVELSPRQKLAIPEGYMYAFVNCSDNASIISRVYKSNHIIDPNWISKLKGLAYLCIRKNAKQEVVYNPKYKNIPSPKKITPKDNHIDSLGFDLSKSLYNLVRTNTEIFNKCLCA